MSEVSTRPRKAATRVAQPMTAVPTSTTAVTNPQPASPAQARSPFAVFSDEATGRWLSARDLLSMCTDQHGEDINFAAESLVELSANLLDAAIETCDAHKLEEAHSEMWRAAALLKYRITDPRADEEEVRVLEGIHFLMESSMDLVMEALKHRGDAA